MHKNPSSITSQGFFFRISVHIPEPTFESCDSSSNWGSFQVIDHPSLRRPAQYPWTSPGDRMVDPWYHTWGEKRFDKPTGDWFKVWGRWTIWKQGLQTYAWIWLPSSKRWKYNWQWYVYMYICHVHYIWNLICKYKYDMYIKHSNE